MRKRILLLTATLLSATMALAGCNTNRSTENIKKAFDSINILEYEEAITSFEVASEAGENPQLIAR